MPISNELKKDLALKRVKTLIILVSRHGKKCWYCGVPFKSFKEVEVDHIVPTSRGGSKILSNFAIACVPCNRAKGNMSLENFLHWLRRPKSPIPYIHERAKCSEAQFNLFGDQIEKGLRIPTRRYARGSMKSVYIKPIKLTM